MTKLLIVCGTGEGQTAKIAERIAEAAERHGLVWRFGTVGG
jgi:flavodoxin